MNDFRMTLDSPITAEQWDMIEDNEFDATDEITFRTKRGKEVTFVKKTHGQLYRHYKGGIYEYIGTAVNTEDHDVQVVYKNVKTGEMWSRPTAMFFETLPDGRQRFEPIQEAEE